MKIKDKTALQKIICFIICLVILTLGDISYFAAETKAETNVKTIKVGFFAFDGYHMQTGNEKDGYTRSGYGYEILQYLAGYGGFQYEYIGYDKSWTEMQDMLANGEIDILTSAQKTPEREERFDFSTFNIGISSAILTVKVGDTKYEISDYANWNGIRVGMIKDNSRNDSFAEYAAEHGFIYESVFFDSIDAMVSELKKDSADKSIDAVLTSDLRQIEGEWIMTEFASSPFYIMVQKGNQELLDNINSAISQLDSCEPGLRTKLMNKYYTPNNGGKISYTIDEREYISQMQKKTIYAVINPDRAPYSWLEDKEQKGIAYDIAQEIISRSELDIQFIDIKTREEYEQAIEDNKATICFDMTDNKNQAEKRGYWLTGSYITMPVASIFLEDTTKYETAAVPDSINIIDNYENKILDKGLKITYYDSVKEVIQAVKDGKNDMAYLAMDTATFAVRNDVTNRLLVAEEVFLNEMTYCIGVENSQSPLLYSILSKAVTSLDEEEINVIRQEYADSLEKPFSLVGFIYDHPSSLVVSGIIVLIISIMFMVIRTQQRMAKEEKLHLQKEQKQNEKLKEAIEAAKKADIAKSQFLSRMSHEIRTPLNAVIGYSTIARNEMAEARTEVEHRQADMKVMDCLTKSDIASKHLLTIINDVLDMSAIESGKIKITNEKFDFKGLINSLTTVFYSQAKNKNVDMEVYFNSHMDEWVVGDQMRINQVLTNLLSNALKFTQDGGQVQMTIFPKNEDDTISVNFEIKDTGIGMTKEGLEHLWKPFEQADTSISRRFGGTGLGLAITKTLVDLMGGTIDVESEPGVGTTFTVHLTLGRTEQPENTDIYDFSKINALIIDDDQSTCDYMRLLLSRSNVRSMAVNSGEMALDALSQAIKNGDSYTICFVDWHMPKMGGIETAKRTREIVGDNMPIIVITAYDYSEIADKAMEIGVSRFLSKPLFQSSLFNLLAEICGTQMPKEKERSSSYDFSSARVLLAEDNDMNMEIARKILETASLIVDSVTNGQQAVEKFESAPEGTYKAILMDVQMPIMDGYTATKNIRASSHPEAKTITIIAMTADAFAENIAESKAVGMNDHISKPIDLPTLYSTLKKYI